MTPEFSRRIALATIGAVPQEIEIEADEAERAALARRFGLTGLDRLRATATLRGNEESFLLEGRLEAAAIQACVVTGEPCPAEIDEPFRLRFLPEPKLAGGEEEIELDGDELDTVFHDGAAIDVGEAVAESLFLALDPYPRAPGAEAALREAGIGGEAEAGAFAALAGLRDKLTK